MKEVKKRINSRRKGGQGERDLVNFLKERGVPAKRISMMESGGIDKGDVEVAGCWKAQVKVGKIVSSFDYEAVVNGEPMLFKKRDRHRWLIVMDLEWFLANFL